MVSDGKIRGYKKAIDYLYDQIDYERHRPSKYDSTIYNLDNMRKFLSQIGDPHLKIKAVHIAGTKGKGSTATMLARMLESCGYKVGLFTSPHINSIRERISIDNNMIPRSELAKLISLIAKKTHKSDTKPTFFEILTAAAFKYFDDSNVDIAILETGLGGRLDSTNVVKPCICGITSISLDHTRQLGNSLAEIAQEKAGIFKKGTPAVSAPQHKDVSSVLKNVATKKGADLNIIGESFDFYSRMESSRELGCHSRFSVSSLNKTYEHIASPLPGQHQAANCALAISLLDHLKDQGFSIDDRAALDGLSRTVMSGRMEMICNEPRILVDGAHNAASMQALVKCIGQRVEYDSMIMIVACGSDKDLRGITEQVSVGADKAIFTRVDESMRSANPKLLSELYTEISDGKACQTAESLSDAITMAEIATSFSDLICICGSFYLVAQAKDIVRKIIHI